MARTKKKQAMKMDDYVAEIKLEITGGLTELEIPDTTLCQVVTKSLRELQRYISTTELITVPFAKCIDLNDSGVSTVTNVFRTQGYTGDTSSSTGSISAIDPMYAQTWMAFSNGGTMYNLSNYVLNYASYNTMLQIRNTISTDLAFRYDKQSNKLYINTNGDNPENITIEYIPYFTKVDQIASDYWKDILCRLSIAQTKIILGRIRSKYKQTNAIWTLDGDTLLAEGNEEIKTLRERLATNAQLTYPID